MGRLSKAFSRKDRFIEESLEKNRQFFKNIFTLFCDSINTSNMKDERIKGGGSLLVSKIKVRFLKVLVTFHLAILSKRAKYGKRNSDETEIGELTNFLLS